MPKHEYADFMLESEALCMEEHAPACRAICPLHVDVREICRLIRTGSGKRARDLFFSGAVLPRITAAACDAPCKDACRMVERGGSVQIDAIERAIVSDPAWNPPKLALRFRSEDRVCVVGTGASGLTAVQALLARGFLVTVFESAEVPGIKFQSDPRIGPEKTEQDLRSFSHYAEWKTGVQVGADLATEALLSGYKAVLITGEVPIPEAYANLPRDPDTLQIGNSSLFYAGRKQCSNNSFSFSLCSGKRAALSMERFVQKLSMTAMRLNEDSYETDLHVSLESVPKSQPLPEPAGGYSESELKEEASRCQDCHCLDCVRECEFLKKFNKFPRLYIREIANTISILRDGVRSGTRLMVACTQCGLCSKICPNSIPMAKIAHDGKAAMVQKNELSPAIYDFPVREMLFANGDSVSLVRHAPGKSRSDYVFFPGCQLCASSPKTVLGTYRMLLSVHPETGLYLGCCGAPADWSGREEIYESTIETIQKNLEQLGNPTVLCTCPTCLRQFEAASIRAESVYPILLGLSNSAKAPYHPFRKVAVHDSCSARDDRTTQDAVRSLLQKAGYVIEELAMSREKTRCCGYGGLVFYGDRDIARKLIAQRASESSLPFVCYCSVCRDYLVQAGKPALHILDILLEKDSEEAWSLRGADVSEKETNLPLLHDTVLKQLYGEPIQKSMQDAPLLIMDEPVRKLLDNRLIARSNVQAVISEAEKTGRYLIRPSDSHRIASLRPGIITYWVEYVKEESAYRIFNAYSHRILIEEPNL